MVRRYMHGKEIYVWQGETCMARRDMYSKECVYSARGMVCVLQKPLI